MLLNKILNLNHRKNNVLLKLKSSFINYCKSTNSPFEIAVNNYTELEESMSSKNELLSCLLEDIIFTSVSLTFFEKLIIVISKNKQLGEALVDEFLNQVEKREDIVTIQTFRHVNYIENGGVCEGCNCCDNHKEVFELLEYYQDQDFDFFIKMYIGMHTIKMTFEELIYKDLSNIIDNQDEVRESDLLNLRQFIYEYSNKNLI